MSDYLLTDKEIQTRLDEYWELYRDLWNADIIDESDYESGFYYWTLEAQNEKTLHLATPEIEAEVKGEITSLLGLCENELGFCEISNHIPYTQLKEWEL